jgi:hypothetical protein
MQVRLRTLTRIKQEIGTAVMRASQHTRTALRTVTQFSQREGLNLEQGAPLLRVFAVRSFT